MKTKFNSKFSKISITIVCMILSVVVVGTANAAAKEKIVTQAKPQVKTASVVQAKPKTKPAIDPAVAKQNFKDMLEIRIAQYKAFIANMPSSLSSADQQALTADMNTSITKMQNVLSNINNASTSVRLSGDDSLIAFKVFLLTQIFHANPVHKAVSTSTATLVKVKAAKTNVSTSTPLTRPSVQQIKENLLTNFALSATTTISSDIVEQVINATSTKVLGDLSHQITQKLNEDRMAASAALTGNRNGTSSGTTSKPSLFSKVKSFLHL